MQNQFIFFCPNIGNELYLKKEISLKWPHLHLAYSRPGFLTYKNSRTFFSLRELSEWDVSFSRRHGCCYGPTNQLSLEADLKKLRLQLDCGESALHIWDVQGSSQSEKGTTLAGQIILNVIQVKDEEFWLGAHFQNDLSSFFPGGFPPIKLPSASPSRAYLKIAEVLDRFPIELEGKEIFMEIGSSPGGATYFLLNQGHRVIGIDPGEMHSICTSHQKFTHYKTPIQDFKKSDLNQLGAEKIDWIAVDMNLDATFSIQQSLRVAGYVKNHLKGMIFTLKIPQAQQVEKISSYINRIQKFGFKTVLTGQVPDHRKEFTLIALKD
ncbi:MAG: hypothetical protein COB67_08105 [SAR324 cluster bacterium]|uniref:Ribosomal RNA methyltransferase FtsJ domain-containing protein n=1 Tax=SAR324 cluster bacterium TaxID=2024889 RepID=A0A2A4T360_9DELT|nr:MAG: hypothetical protein COB67_08105 [SAR324 cluster bacterium]